ncbi:MAG: hypothetical protein F4X44_12250 [Gammaproteobacteria bacterium]|nr:hypothetical protein [Gammaproteobacteria bacterium]
MIKQLHVNLAALALALAAALEEVASVLPDTGDVTASVVLVALSLGISTAVTVYNSNKNDDV